MAPKNINLTQIDALRQVREAVFASAITPGDLVQPVASTGKYQHPQASAPLTGPLFALPALARGGDYSTPYVAGERGRYFQAYPGDEVYAFLASGYSCQAHATQLIGASTADGALMPASTQTGKALLATALESIATVTAKTRVKVRVL